MIGIQAYQNGDDLHNPQIVLRPSLLLVRDTQLQARSATSSHILSPCQSGCRPPNPRSPHCRWLAQRCMKAYASRARCFPRRVQCACALQTVVDGTGTGGHGATGLYYVSEMAGLEGQAVFENVERKFQLARCIRQRSFDAPPASAQDGSANLVEC